MSEPIPCGGCGATESNQRCIGCLHDFGTEESKWVRQHYEQARMDQTIQERTTDLKRIIKSAKALALRKRDPNWSFVGQLFGVGSTYAWEICRRAGINPDATTID